MDDAISLSICLIGVLAVCCQIIAWQLRLPAILFLLLAGIICGPISGILLPDKVFGELLFPLTSLAVAIILFEGSLTLKFSEIIHQSKTLLRLITIGPLIVCIGVSVTAFHTEKMSWESALLLGAIMIVSGPTVIKPLLKAVRPKANIAKLLYWDSIILDPIGALLVMILTGYYLSEQTASPIPFIGFQFISFLLFGVLFGFINGYLLGEMIKRHWFPNMLENIIILNWVLAAFVSANLLFHETGLLVVTIMGLTIANRKEINIDSILDFKETISTLLLSALFIVLAARIELKELFEVIPESLIIFGVMQFIIQPIKIHIVCLGSDLNWKERFMLAWIAPKGIVAAALVSILAVKLRSIGYIHAEVLIPITFLLIVYSVTLPSLTAGFLAKVLDVAQPKENGVLILGANRLARSIATILVKHDIPVIVADSSWENIRLARLAHIPTYYGNITSDNAERTLDLTGIGNLYAISPNTELSTLSRLRYKRIFGKGSIYYLQTEAEKNLTDRHLIAQKNRGELLFGETWSYETLTQSLDNGAKLRATTLTSEFTYQDYLEKHKKNCVPLFSISKRNKLNPRLNHRGASVGATVVAIFYE